MAPVPVSSASPNTGGGYQPTAIPRIGQSSHNTQLGRKRNASTAELDSSPGSQESAEHDGTIVDNDGKRHPVKRACNECRQQKVSHMGEIGRIPCLYALRSYDAMSNRIQFSMPAADATAYSYHARSTTRSNVLASDRAMRRWSEKSKSSDDRS